MSQESLSERLLDRVGTFHKKVKESGIEPSHAQLSIISLVEEAGNALAKVEARKPVAWLGMEKTPIPGAEKVSFKIILVFPDHPRSEDMVWTPLFDE